VCPKHIIHLSSVTRRIIREYTTEECTTPCQRACPAGIDIREYIRQIDKGDYRRAVQVIKERNPFPTVIGRICPRPCEEQCRRQYVDEAVAINHLKRFVADYERAAGQRVQPYKAPETGRRIAVAGGGVSGLSTAFFSARLGHGAVVFDAREKLGGLLRSAIAAERLSMEVLDWDIQGILDMGVQAETGKVLGRDVSIPSLLAGGFDAVYLATGGWDSRSARKDAAKSTPPIQGMTLMIDLMRTAENDPGSVKGKDVVIVAAGPFALKAAEMCRAQGAESVRTVFRGSSRDIQAGTGGDNDVFCYETGVHKIYGIGSNVTGVDLMDLDTRDVRHVSANLLIFDSGRYPELIFVNAPDSDAGANGEAAGATAAAGTESVEWEAVIPYKKPEFSNGTGLFSPGDAFTDFSAAIKAIGAGRRAAASIHQMMNGLMPMLDDRVVTRELDVQNVDHVDHVQPSSRRMMPVAGPAELSAGVELEKGYAEAEARGEAKRCLQCGLICYQQTEIGERPQTAHGAYGG
jgi:NADPH-dependent glutamate synthase beta subunit-like oxidoreductase